MIHVRPAEMTDRAWMLEQLHAFAHFYGTRKSLIPSDPDIAITLLSTLISSQVVFVADSVRPQEASELAEVATAYVQPTPNTPVGFIAGMLGSHPYNPEIRTLTELFWWVLPEYRGTRAGAMLFAAFDAYGRRYADWILLSQIEGKSPIDPASLENRGYHLHERSYLKEVAEGARV